ncbi:hypothetical protein [Reinekea sp.]|uniref:hypothetical protein n=1 Tax=Reinekea sp. TaxID=1970455 RepID=UPI002A7FB37F|nr:hypothetical protein [Reinekea sp.]
MKWTLSIVISCLMLSGCIGISTKSMPESSNILVVSQTSNEYQLTHLSFNIFPPFRNAHTTIIDPGWTMTSLWNDQVRALTQDSRFEFTYLDEPIQDYENDKSLNYALRDLAEANDADYVLVLKSSSVPNDIGLKTEGGHYGYVHESSKGSSDIGRVYANVHVRLLDATTLDKALFKFRSCGRVEPLVFTYQKTEQALTLPDRLGNIELTSVLVAEEVADVSEITKALAVSEIEQAVGACKLG